MSAVDNGNGPGIRAPPFKVVSSEPVRTDRVEETTVGLEFVAPRVASADALRKARPDSEFQNSLASGYAASAY